jgi:uncharacterized protein (DUF2336 family)
MGAEFSLVGEIDTALAHGSPGRRAEMLRRVTDLFIVEADELSDQQIELFDDVIMRLAAEIEQSTRTLLAIRLAPIRNAPPRTIRNLAFDDAVDVAAPVLCQSERLDDADLVENARTKGQGHMLAISRRSHLSEIVTDVLIERGDRQVLISTAQNRTARFSDSGFSKLAQRSDGNEELTICVGERDEIPLHLFRQLIKKASQSVRAKLEAAQPELSRQIREVVAEVSDRIELDAIACSSDYSATLTSIEGDQGPAQLKDGDLMKLALTGAVSEVIAALAGMSDAPILFVEKTIRYGQTESLLVLARAIGLSWPAVKAILMLETRKRSLSENEIAQLLASYERLKPKTAQEILRFYRSRDKQRN